MAEADFDKACDLMTTELRKDLAERKDDCASVLRSVSISENQKIGSDFNRVAVATLSDGGEVELWGISKLAGGTEFRLRSITR